MDSDKIVMVLILIWGVFVIGFIRIRIYQADREADAVIKSMREADREFLTRLAESDDPFLRQFAEEEINKLDRGN